MQIDIPCKIGDAVWAARKYNGVYRAECGIVRAIYFLDDMRLVISVRGLCRGIWGEHIFANRLEAERGVEKLNSRAKNS